MAEDEKLSDKLLPHVKNLVEAKKEGDEVGIRSAEAKINALAGPKTIPRGFTAEEKQNPKKLAKVISCVSQVKGKKGVDNPFAVCRESILKAAPETITTLGIVGGLVVMFGPLLYFLTRKS